MKLKLKSYIIKAKSEWDTLRNENVIYKSQISGLNQTIIRLNKDIELLQMLLDIEQNNTRMNK